jgi:hypothetical protein
MHTLAVEQPAASARGLCETSAITAITLAINANSPILKFRLLIIIALLKN